METLIDILSWPLIIAGSVFTLIGGVGMVRLPDMYTRMHAASVTETLGTSLLLLGMLLHATHWLIAGKILMLGFFLFVTSPTSAHALAKTALQGGLKPKLSKAAEEEDSSKS